MSTEFKLCEKHPSADRPEIKMQIFDMYNEQKAPLPQRAQRVRLD